MKRIILLAAFLSGCSFLNAQSQKIMLVTGGHAFDTVAFFQLFDELESVTYQHLQQPRANEAIARGAAEEMDVLVFYDMWPDISPEEKQAYLHLTREGKPFLFLHHSLASYQQWDEFEKLLGGKYVEKAPGIPAEEQSTFKHDVWVDIAVPDPKHPITKGWENIRLFDEVYGNFRVSEDVKPLLKTDHPQSGPVIGWENRYNASTIVYLQPGHDAHVFDAPVYREMLLRAIRYLAGKNSQ